MKCECSIEEKLAYQKYRHDKCVYYLQCRINQKEKLISDHMRKIKEIRNAVRIYRKKIKSMPTKHYIHWCEKAKELSRTTRK